MDELKCIIEEKIEQHNVTLRDLTDLEQDMKDFLRMTDSIYYINCKDLVIKVDTTINKLMFKECENITVDINGLIAGLDIDKSSNISTVCRTKIGSIIVNNSSEINLEMSKQHFDKNTYCEINYSKNVNIMDPRKHIYLSK